MNEIKSVSLTGMNNGAHFAFHSEVIKLVEADTNLNEKLPEQISNYKKAIANEQNVIKLPQKSLYSDEIAKADSERDALYKGLKSAISAYAAIPNEEQQKAYKVLSQLVKDYNIKSTMQIDQATGLLIKFIDDLETKYSEEVKKLSLNNFVTPLKEANERLRVAISNRNQERSDLQRPAGALRQARMVADEQYRTFVKYVNAYALIEGVSRYESFISQINKIIIRYKVQVIKGRNKLSSSKETTN